MSVASARALLASALDADATVSSFLVRGPHLAAGVLSRIDFEAELAREVDLDVRRHAARLLDREWLPYDPAYQPSPAQALLDELPLVPHLQRLHTELVRDDLPIDRQPDLPVVAMAHRLDLPTPVVAYRVQGAGIATRRPRGLRALVPRDGVYERHSGDLLWYEPRVDVLVCGDDVLVTAPTTLQRRLQAPERAAEMAARTFTRITRQLRIEGVADLLAAVAGDPVMVAKMAALHRLLEADPGYADLVTTERLLAFVDANPDIGVAVTGTGPERRLLFEPAPQQRYRIVKLLADDYLRSELTDRRYEAGSKHRL